jgi:hypothetical protein
MTVRTASDQRFVDDAELVKREVDADADAADASVLARASKPPSLIAVVELRRNGGRVPSLDGSVSIPVRGVVMVEGKMRNGPWFSQMGF